MDADGTIADDEQVTNRVVKHTGPTIPAGSKHCASLVWDEWVFWLPCLPPLWTHAGGATPRLEPVCLWISARERTQRLSLAPQGPGPVARRQCSPVFRRAFSGSTICERGFDL